MRTSQSKTNSKTKKAETFRANLLEKAKLSDRAHSLDTEEQKRFRELNSFFRETDIIAFLDGVGMTEEILTRPAYPKEREGYAALMDELFWEHADTRRENRSSQIFHGFYIWKEYLETLLEKSNKLPSAHAELLTDIVEWHATRWRKDLAPTWTDRVFEQIDHALSRLHPKEERILRARFGIGESKKEMKEIIELFGPFKEGTRQDANIRLIERKALSKLHQPNFNLERFMRPIANALDESLAREAVILAIQVEEANKQCREKELNETRATSIALETLLKTVDCMELSVRTTNCLDNNRLVFVGDVITFTEDEILRWKNFGRKSMEELRDELSKRGLYLGMVLTPDLLHAFHDARAKYVS